MRLPIPNGLVGFVQKISIFISWDSVVPISGKMMAYWKRSSAYSTSSTRPSYHFQNQMVQINKCQRQNAIEIA